LLWVYLHVRGTSILILQPWLYTQK
jgi:hypothetical protein